MCGEHTKANRKKLKKYLDKKQEWSEKSFRKNNNYTLTLNPLFFKEGSKRKI